MPGRTLVVAALAWALVPAALAGDLQTLTQKNIQKTDKAILKADGRLDKLEARVALKAGKEADLTALVAALEVDLLAAEADVVAAEAELAAAQALPAGTEEEELARDDALAEAAADLKAAGKVVKALTKQLAKAENKLGRARKALTKAEDRRDVGEDVLLDLEDDLDLLQSTFDFSSTRVVPLGLRIVDDEGAPLAGLQVTITDVLVPPKAKKKKKKKQKTLEDVASPFTYWQGFTGADGRIDTEAVIALAAEDVDLIVHAPGYTGDYSHESLRETWGPFAPAARTSHPTRDLADLEIVLDGEAP